MNWLQKTSNKQPWEMSVDEYYNYETRSNAIVSTSELVGIGGTNREERYIRSTARYRDMLERMKRYGFEGNIINSPPVILRRTIDGGLQIEDGNHRVAAAIDAGIERIPVEIINQPFHKDVIERAQQEGKTIPPEALERSKIF